MFSKTPWYHIPIFWLPWAVYFMLENTLTVGATLWYIFLGIFLWSFIEYFLHRFLFHSEDHLPDNKFVFLFHFLLHGIHHAFPQDPLRLVFPIILGYSILLTLILPLFNNVFPEELCPTLKTGVIFGYIGYDLTHYFIHHSSPKEGYFKFVKMYHMAHHYRDGEAGFGVSQKFWDIIFRTELDL